MARMRLQKILARAGVASRRAAEEIITAGRVAVDGQVVRELGAKADPLAQRITLDSKPLPRPEPLEYWLVHKPVGVVSTVKDPEGRQRVVDLLPPEAKGRLFPVGRLDADSEGLVLLTNDGPLAQKLMHPSGGVAKTYRAWVKGRPGARALEALRQGVALDDGRTAPALVTAKSAGPDGSKLRLVLFEGRKREVRRMCAAVGHPVQRLVRVGLGPLSLGDLPPGAARRLSGREVEALRKAGGKPAKPGCKPGGDGVKKSATGRSTKGTRSPRRRRDQT